MGKSSKAPAKPPAKPPAPAASSAGATFAWPALLVLMCGVTVLCAHHVGQGERPGFMLRLLFFLMLDSFFCKLFSAFLLPLSRIWAARAHGATVPALTSWSSWDATDDEHATNDASLPWPRDREKLPPGWIAAPPKKGPPPAQPYFTNHVRGSMRCRHAALRLAAALASVAAAAAVSALLDHRPLAALGVRLDARFAADVGLGVGVGALIVTAMTAAELACGWGRVHGVLESFDASEKLSLNLFYDVLFHAAVSVNEELPMRGWLLLNAADALCAAFPGAVGAGVALLLAVALESLLFAALHLSSPGASALSLINLTIGGAAAAANVLLSGGLGFALGWHFGWNIVMGNVLGRSTSGIPVSATVIVTVPHPALEALHGGANGPEGGPLAPLAYLLGLALLAALYGLDRWREGELCDPAFEALHAAFKG